MMIKKIKTFENFSNSEEDFDYRGQHSAPSPLNNDLPMNDYAKQHGRSNLKKYKILTKTVYVDELYTDGNDILEWGYHKRLKTFEGFFNFSKKENPSFSDISEEEFNKLAQEIKDSLIELGDIGLDIKPILTTGKRPLYVLMIDKWEESTGRDIFTLTREMEEILRFSTDYIRDFGIKLVEISVTYYDDIDIIDGTVSKRFTDIDKFFEFVNHAYNNNVDFVMVGINLWYDI